MSSTKHKPEMIAAWAKENGIRGYEMYDPRNRDADRRRKIISRRKKLEEEENKKKLQTTVTRDPNGMNKVTKTQGNVSMEYYE